MKPTHGLSDRVERVAAGPTSEWQTRCCAFCGEMVVVESERSCEMSLAEMLGEATCPVCGESNLFVVGGVVRSVHARQRAMACVATIA